MKPLECRIPAAFTTPPKKPVFGVLVTGPILWPGQAIERRLRWCPQRPPFCAQPSAQHRAISEAPRRAHDRPRARERAKAGPRGRERAREGPIPPEMTPGGRDLTGCARDGARGARKMPKISIFAPILTGIIDAWDRPCEKWPARAENHDFCTLFDQMLDAWDSF